MFLCRGRRVRCSKICPQKIRAAHPMNSSTNSIRIQIILFIHLLNSLLSWHKKLKRDTLKNPNNDWTDCMHAHPQRYSWARNTRHHHHPLNQRPPLQCTIPLRACRNRVDRVWTLPLRNRSFHQICKTLTLPPLTTISYSRSAIYHFTPKDSPSHGPTWSWGNRHIHQ